jgi:peroxiredoxin Q/BCP
MPHFRDLSGWTDSLCTIYRRLSRQTLRNPKEIEMSQITEGSTAPDFALPADGGSTLTLSSLRGRIVVLYFYPKDDTSGCTKEAIAFSQLKPEFEALGAVVIGMSPDTAAKHDKFKAKHDLSVDACRR